MRTLDIGIDMDETVDDMIAKILPLYNAEYNDNLKYHQITEYDIGNFIKPECASIFEEYVNDDFISTMKVADDAVDVLSRLATRHEVFFVTAGHPFTMAARDRWLSKHFPFYKTRNLIMCREKTLLNLDILVDDHHMNLIGAKYCGILINKPWNLAFPERIYNIKRIFGFGELENLIESTIGV